MCGALHPRSGTALVDPLSNIEKVPESRRKTISVRLIREVPRSCLRQSGGRRSEALTRLSHVQPLRHPPLAARMTAGRQVLPERNGWPDLARTVVGVAGGGAVGGRVGGPDALARPPTRLPTRPPTPAKRSSTTGQPYDLARRGPDCA